jgi:uroporphyrinogen decarboxylase
MNLVNVLNKKKVEKLPIWIMRQAGRYLPEFRELKKKSKGFMNMIYTPKIASDVTLQPIKRFGFDAAIIFSDILIIPDSLGQRLTYKEGKGPALERMSIDQMIKKLSVNKEKDKLNLVYEAIRKTKKKLNRQTNLIGFVGAPLTIALFMFNGNRNRGHRQAFKILKKNKQKTKKLFNLLERAIARHAINQLKAGAEIIQIFDTWASVAKNKDLQIFSVNPIKRICDLIKKKKPKKHIIVFPRNVGTAYTKYIYKHIDCISVGEDIKEQEIKKIQKQKTIQGNLSPQVLFDGGKKLENETKKILNKFSSKPFIFNLSHGIMPGTPLRNVQKLIDIIRKHKNEV